MTVKINRLLILGILLSALLLLAGSTSARASSVWWGTSSGARPTVLAPDGTGEVIVTSQNLGYTSTDGVVTIEDHLPVGLRAIGIKASAGGHGVDARGPVKCSLVKVSCTYGDIEENAKKEPVENPKQEILEALPPYELIEMKITVQVDAEAESGPNTVIVAGGGGGSVKHATNTIHVGDAPAGFGFENYSLDAENESGAIDTQAGSHPFQLTTSFTWNNKGLNAEKNPLAVGMAKTIIDQLPAGLVGNPTPFAQCTDQQFAAAPGGSEFITNECPAASAVGVATIQFTDPEGEYATTTGPIFNQTPLPGEPARFSFKVAGIISVFLDTSVRTGKDYGVTVTTENITELASVTSVRLTFWGVPGDKRHDLSRGWECMYHFGSCPVTQTKTPPPFLVMPTSCESPLSSTISANSWPAEGNPSSHTEAPPYQPSEGIDGCNHLPFAPSISVTPDVSDGSTSTGVLADVHVPQSAALNPEGLAESSVRDISVKLPEGMALNPAGADGLEACSEGLVGYLPGESNPPENLHFTSSLPEPLQPGVNFCPNGSKVGTVKITTPLLPNPLEGAVYLAAQNANPFGSLVAMYVEAKDPVSGTLVKLPGEVSLNPTTGQVTATFKNSPQLPFEDAELHFFGGERAPLATPAQCGTYTTNASFAPWSGNEPVPSESHFAITSGPHGSPCPGASLQFAPSLTGGSSNINAGAFSPLITTISREDGQQPIQSVQLHMPPGLSGILTGIPLCPEAQANAGTCSQASRIGTTIVSVGVGNDPFSVTGGEVFLTEHYAGAPFGLSIVNPAVAGPFNLGKVIVRAKVEVDPTTAALTVTTDQSGPHAIPTILDGIPLQIKHVNVTIDKPGFTFNPTNCNAAGITGSITSNQGTSSPVSSSFQVTNCASLAFAPKFAVTTSAKTSKANGASLGVKLTYPNAPFGSQANIKQVKVELPKALPSRLTTLQKACTSAQFDANPAGCPAASIIGHARAITPLLPVPLEGPAYFVSHGGEAFPSLIMVLQGYGVTLDLVGTTFISKAGITSSTFKTVPDAPVGLFELNLPEGPYSALTANGNLCSLTKTVLVKKKVTVKVKGHKQTLTRKVRQAEPETRTMPTEFVAQNGTTLHRSTPVNVTGCPKAKKAAKKKAAKPKQGKRK